MNTSRPTLKEIAQHMQACDGYLSGLYMGLSLLLDHYPGTADDWHIDYNNVKAEYREVLQILNDSSKLQKSLQV